jgi:hypothetical protein
MEEATTAVHSAQSSRLISKNCNHFTHRRQSRMSDAESDAAREEFEGD